jgi:hypothetical protein
MQIISLRWLTILLSNLREPDILLFESILYEDGCGLLSLESIETIMLSILAPSFLKYETPVFRGFL